MVARRLREGRQAEIADITAEAITGATWAILAPYTGSQAAVETIEAAQARPRRLAAR